MILGAVILSLAFAGQVWTPPQSQGPWAHGLRDRIAALYAGLQRDGMRLVPDLAKIDDSLRGPTRARGWDLVRDGGARPGGSEVLRLVWTDSVNATVRSDLLSVRVVREELVPFAQRRFAVGQIVDTGGLRWEWRRTDGVVLAPPRRTELQGRVMRRGVGPGQELSSTALEDPFLFRRKDRVKVVMDRAGAGIVAEGIAMEDGISGRLIKLQGPFGNTIRGRVLPDSSVRIE